MKNKILRVISCQANAYYYEKTVYTTLQNHRQNAKAKTLTQPYYEDVFDAENFMKMLGMGESNGK